LKGGGPVTVHVNTERGFRGGEVQALGLVRHLDAQGRRTLLLAHPESPLLERARTAGVEAYPFRAFGEWDLLAALRLRRFLRDQGADLVHAHTAHALSLALLARGIGDGFAVVASRRVSFPLRSALSRSKYRRADTVLAVSGPIRDSLLAEGLVPERVSVVHSGVDLGRFQKCPPRAVVRRELGIAPDRFVVGVVAALESHKGHGTFLEAFNLFWREVPTGLALLVGEGRRRREIAHHAEAQGLPFLFTGHVEEPASLYGAMDLLVLPSVSGEGSPGVVKEAAAAGVPVVATDVSGTREILRDGLEALLVPPRDSRALARSMARLALDPALAKALSRAALDRVREFSLAATAERTWEVYLEVLARRRGRAGVSSR